MTPNFLLGNYKYGIANKQNGKDWEEKSGQKN